MSLKARFTDDVKTAMRAKDSARLQAIRFILSGIKQVEIDKRIELGDEDILALLNKMLKQRRDSIAQFQKANRQELVDKEQFEVEIIQQYLPEQLAEAEVLSIIAAAISAAGATSAAHMGKVMSILKAQLHGKTDMSQVSAKVKQQLS